MFRTGVQVRGKRLEVRGSGQIGKQSRWLQKWENFVILMYFDKILIFNRQRR